MNSWLAGAILLSVWLYGLFILRGLGECIQRLRRIENQMNDNVKGNHL